MKRSSGENGAEMPTSSRPAKVPRLRRVPVESDPPAGVASTSSSNPGSSSSDSATSIPSDGSQSGSTGIEVRPTSSDKCQKVMPVKPHIAKRGLKRAGPYLLGNIYIFVYYSINEYYF